MCPFDQTVNISRTRALRIYVISKTSTKSIHSDVRGVMALQSAAVNHSDTQVALNIVLQSYTLFCF